VRRPNTAPREHQQLRQDQQKPAKLLRLHGFGSEWEDFLIMARILPENENPEKSEPSGAQENSDARLRPLPMSMRPWFG
jgi:hypothetical protein